MSEKQSEAFDEWFKNAADGHEPPFNEEAWKKMEAKLDGQTKRRRRPLAWWWWLTDALVVGVVLYMAFGHNVGVKKENGTDNTITNILPQTTPAKTNKDAAYDKDKAASLEKDQTGTQATLPITADSENPITPNATKAKTADNSIDKSVISDIRTAQEKIDGGKASNAKFKDNGDKVYTSGSSVKKKKNTKSISIETGKADKKNYLLFAKNDKSAKGKLTPKNNNSVKGKEYKNDVADNNNMQPDNTLQSDEQLLQSKLKQNTITATNPIDSSISGNKLVVEKKLAKDSLDKAVIAKTKDSLDAAALKTSQKKKDKDKKQSDKGRFFIYGAASPEWSFIFGNKTGKATMAYGAGIGYSLGKRWSVLAGFNITKKLYTAGKGDYKITKGSYWDNPNITITNIDANCNVYEIPVSVRYIILQAKRYSVYGSLGVSTAIMKKEVYDYDYTRNGWPNYYTRAYQTGKSQFLSGAIVSLGYSRKLNKSFGVMAEPYFKMPLQGVGEGKVKIGSVGVSVGVQYNLPKFKR